MADQLKGFDRLGNKISFSEDQRAAVEKMGGRVATQAELTEHKLQKQYEAQSTTQKALGYAKFVGPVGSIANAIGGGGEAAPQLEAYREGARSGFSAGVAPAAERVITSKLQGEQAGRKVAERVDALETAFPTTTSVGKVAGTVASAFATGGGGAATAAAPAGVISAAASPIEAGVAKALGGLATKGTLGRAATTAAAMGVRGAVEGAAYAGVEQAASDVLHDTPITGRKIYSAMGSGALAGGGLGAALGGVGSLIGSGVQKVAGSFTRRASETAEEVSGVTALLKPKGGATASEASGASTTLEHALTSPDNYARGLAQEQAFKSIGGGFGLQSTRYAKQAQKYLPNGVQDLGEVAIRRGIVDMGDAATSPTAAAWQAAKNGTPTDMLPKIAAERELVGQEIGQITKASNATVDPKAIEAPLAKIRSFYEKQAGREDMVRHLDTYSESLLQKLPVNGEGKVAVQDLLEQRKFLDNIVYEEANALDPKGRVKVLREARTEIENVIGEALDSASGQVPGELRTKYQTLKKDYHALSIINEAAEDSAARAAKGSTLGLGEKFAVAQAVATGNFAAAPILGIGGKLLRERGNAAAAAFLQRAADQGTFTALVRRFDSKLNGAATGVLKSGAESAVGAARPGPYRATSSETAAPAARARQATTGKAQQGAVQRSARDVMQWVGKARADPTEIIKSIEDAAEMIGKAAGPKAAEGYTMSTLRAIQFVSSYIPERERRDPLDPQSTPQLSHQEARMLVQAAKYASHPETVYDDFERGVVTDVGIKAAKFLDEDSFAEFQAKLFDRVQDQLVNNRRLTQTQRLQVDKLLESPAGPDFRPETVRLLQSSAAPPQPAPNPGGPPPHKPMNLRVQPTGPDAIEARRSG